MIVCRRVLFGVLYACFLFFEGGGGGGLFCFLFRFFVAWYLYLFSVTEHVSHEKTL